MPHRLQHWENEVYQFISQYAAFKIQKTPEQPTALISEQLSIYLFEPLEQLPADFGTERLQGIHLWKDQWANQKEIICSRLLSALGITQRIHGRKCKVIPISNPELINFLEQNHLHTPLRAKIKYGLIYEGALVAVMAFSHPRQISRNGNIYKSFELIRHCNKSGYTVVGGFSKLLKHFIQEKSPDDIMTYVDLEWSKGESYLQFGFEEVGISPAQFFYLDQTQKKRIYPHLIGQDGKFVNQQLIDSGFRVVYNHGNIKLLLKLK
ncbi:hypothetical protein [Persicobacter sp. CCB-QB2]|uniref:hypothetical protein n=1 Tax=Persicobacter sp. CCB-QB2 TaxID=1561025 RepID=UPI0006A96A5F|nr:hypothetical protein [Persicobacter sp. CCB-QB2]